LKLLFDANLSRHLVQHIADLFPGSVHVSLLGAEPEDIEIWDYAAANGFVVVTKDSDFYRMSMVWGAPPKVIWLKLGNAGSRVVADTLRDHAVDLLAFAADSNSAIVSVGAPLHEKPTQGSLEEGE
jgi:predicted nuclease of predicted toxin-antitoxin system